MFLLKRFSTKPRKHTAKSPTPQGGRTEDPSLPLKEESPAKQDKEISEGSVSASSKQEPIRLLLASEFGRFASSGVPFFELVPTDAYEEVDVESFLSSKKEETAVISWRWGNPKPRTLEDAKTIVGDPTKNPVSVDLVQFVVHCAKEDPTIKYLWLDWSCAPQYPDDINGTMREINRSGMYYSNARHLLVWCFDALDDSKFKYSTYFERAWTLSERLHRSKGSRPLKGAEVIPPCVSQSLKRSGKPLDLDPNAPPWGVLLAKAMAKLHLSASMNDGGLLPEVIAEFVSETVCVRYPLIASALDAVEGKRGSLVRVLSPQVLAGLAIALRLRAICEWIRYPNQADDMSGVLGFTPKALKALIIGVTLQQGRMTLNNYHSKLNGILENLVSVHAELRAEANDTPVDESPAMKQLEEAIRHLYEEACSERTVEVVDDAWLRRYLTFEIATYSAFMEQDKLFAIYKLFGEAIADRTYNEVEQVWSDLGARAKLDHMNKQESGVYGWLRELSVIGLESEASSRKRFFAENKRRRRDLPSCDPANFGIYSFPARANAMKESWTMEKMLMHPDVAKQTQVVSYLLGFNLDERAAAKLGKKTALTVVNKDVGGEIDTHLSLRGRKALGNMETDLHALIASTFSFPLDEEEVVKPSSNRAGQRPPPFVLEKNNGLFVLLRYHGLTNLCQMLVIRTACYEDQKWTVESVGCCTSEPMKGSSWGVARVVENLIKDLSELEYDHHQVEYVFKFIGNCAPYSETCTIEPSIQPSSGEGHEGFFSWVVDPLSNHERGATTFNEGLLIKKETEDVGDLVVFGKTTFDTKTEFNRLQKASQRIASLGVNQDTISIYYNLLQRNYVHDSIMAQHLDYFGQLCEILSSHLEKLPFLLDNPSIRQSFEYLCEDMSDALDMAGEEGTDPEVIRHTREALAKLSGFVTMDD